METVMNNARSLRITVGGGLIALAVCGASPPGNAAEPAAHTVAATVQQVPQVPLWVDGVSYPPAKIHDFDGQPLYFLVHPGGTDGTLTGLDVFTRFAEFNAVINERLSALYGRPITRNLLTGETVAPFRDVKLDRLIGPSGQLGWGTAVYEDINLGGKRLAMPVGTFYPNLKNVSCGWGCNWNDRISSLQDFSSYGTKYTSDSNENGRVFYTMPNTVIMDLRPSGWTDVISCIWVRTP